MGIPSAPIYEHIHDCHEQCEYTQAALTFNFYYGWVNLLLVERLTLPSPLAKKLASFKHELL